LVKYVLSTKTRTRINDQPTKHTESKDTVANRWKIFIIRLFTQHIILECQGIIIYFTLQLSEIQIPVHAISESTREKLNFQERPRIFNELCLQLRLRVV